TPVSRAFQASFVPFPDLTTAVSQLQGGNSGQAAKLIAAMKANGQLASDAYNSINQIPVANQIAGDPKLLDLIDAQNFLGQSLKLYQQIAQILQDAGQATGDTQATLVTQAQGLMSVGASLFQDGIQKINNLRIDLGVPAQ